MKRKKADDVFFRKYGDKTIVYQTSCSKIHIMNGACFDVLKYYENTNNDKSIYEYIAEANGISADDCKDDIDEFVQELVKMGILSEENASSYASKIEGSMFEDGTVPEGTLYNCMFELTYRCNERCKHCYCVTNNSDGELTTDEVKHLLDELKRMNAFEVTFTGGDIFVRRDTFEILRYAYSLGFVINIFTNGIALNENDFLELQKIHPKSISFSIYDSIPEKHDAFTTVKGSFEKTVAAARKCVALGIVVKIKSNVTHDNRNRLSELIELVKSIGAKLELTLSITPKNDGSLEPTQFRLDGEDEYVEALRIINKYMIKEEHVDNETREKIEPDDNRRLCWAGVHGISINPYGKVFACNALLIECGDVRKQSIKEIWKNSEELKRIRQYRLNDLSECKNCSEKKYCAFCMGNALNETGSPVKKYLEACNITKAQMRLRKENNNV